MCHSCPIAVKSSALIVESDNCLNLRVAFASLNTSLLRFLYFRLSFLFFCSALLPFRKSEDIPVRSVLQTGMMRHSRCFATGKEVQVAVPTVVAGDIVACLELPWGSLGSKALRGAPYSNRAHLKPQHNSFPTTLCGVLVFDSVSRASSSSSSVRPPPPTTTLSHTICHIPSVTYINLTHNFVTYHLSHTICHIHNFTHTFVTYHLTHCHTYNNFTHTQT